MKLAIFGAAGATGRHAVEQAVKRGHAVRALEPTWDGAPDLPPGVETHTADLLSGDLSGALDGCDAVLSCVGVGMSMQTAIDPPPLYSRGASAIVAEMRRTGVKRLVVISATFVQTLDRGPLLFRGAAGVGLHKVFEDMDKMEGILRDASDIDWTAVRPGWLIEGPLTDDYTVTADVIPEDMIRTRHADLAHFMLTLAEGDEWSHATPAIARPEPDEASGPQAVLKNLVG